MSHERRNNLEEKASPCQTCTGLLDNSMKAGGQAGRILIGRVSPTLLGFLLGEPFGFL